MSFQRWPHPADYAELQRDLAGERDTPLPRARTVPSSWFVDPRFAPLDRAAVFGRAWQPICHESELADGPAWRTGEVADEPVLVVRDAEGRLRAFYNVCRHRGGPVATGPGCGRVLKCGYHGWTYQLDGSLRGVPQWDRVELFDRADYGLVPLELASWEGLLFVRLEGAGPSPAEMLEGVAARALPTRLDRMRREARVVYDVAANWKVYVENFLEGYHVPMVHPELVRLYDYASYATEVSEHHVLQSSRLDDTPDGRGAGGEALYYCLFPNVMLNILPGRLQTNVVLATGPESCRVVFDYYYEADPAETDAQRADRIRTDMEFADRVQAEDIDICERVQRGLASRAYDRGRFSVKFEGGVHWFENRLAGAYDAWLAAPAPPPPAATLDPRHETPQRD